MYKYIHTCCSVRPDADDTPRAVRAAHGAHTTSCCSGTNNQQEPAWRLPFRFAASLRPLRGSAGSSVARMPCPFLPVPSPPSSVPLPAQADSTCFEAKGTQNRTKFPVLRTPHGDSNTATASVIVCRSTSQPPVYGRLDWEHDGHGPCPGTKQRTFVTCHSLKAKFPPP
jgi:hypothetical protein